MPKRGGRSRGASRGGRGGSSGGDSFRNFNLSKSSKRRHSKKKAAAHAKHDAPELMDLGTGEYIPQVDTTMNSLSKRPNRHMISEAQYTDKHIEQTMAQPLRYRGIEFVKARGTYDPSKDLIDLLKKRDQEGCDSDQKDDLSAEMGRLNVEPEFAEPIESEHHSVSKGDASTFAEIQQLPVEDLLGEPIGESPIPRSESEESVKNTEEKETHVSHDKTSDFTNSGVIIEDTSSSEIPQVPINVAFESSIPPDENLTHSAHGISETSRPMNDHQERDFEVNSDQDSDGRSLGSSTDDLFIIDETGDDEVFKKHYVKKKPIAVLINDERTKALAPRKIEAESAPATEHDSYLMVGGVMLKTSTDEYGNMTADFPSDTREGMIHLNYSDGHYEEMSEDTDEEAAFEDYKAQIVGALEFEDDGSDDDIVEDFPDLHDYGNSDHGDHDDRSAFKEMESDDFDDFDDSDMSDGDEGGLNSEEEGLEDILAFARSQQTMKNQFDIAPTETIKKRGKGKKQRLELGSHLELELRESLMEQFQYQRQSRKDKKVRKMEKRKRDGIELHDLKIKYDYSLHVQEIKQEFEVFLHDAARETMSFPPLDGHGNKTINKLAGHYNMKCIRCGGNGLSLFMKVAKTRKTFRYIPAYDQIGYIMKQRPVFKRVDVKPRTKDEISATDGKKERHGPKNIAIVREGDIVGGKAPEIGNNNIGRQLLEKLGWVKGEGLGAHGNKGISEPLTATVKRSKTGLK